ncbi:MAG TPA: zinc-binding dehydrogenase [Armatimonadota bacterium]|jgi:threonine dehydrogenase-like Zn-dependent dehydrogenase
MSDVLQRFRAVEHAIPTQQHSWFLYGVGLENLGKDQLPVENTVPTNNADELLVRCDATGLCFSDIKIITQGGEHIRIKRDIAVDPVIMGHESVVTVVKVGDNLKDKFSVGQRFVVQADIYINGQTRAYGYALPGALTQYETMGWEILNGDDGCYLLPIAEGTGYAQAALTEPWACVVHSYVLNYRQGVKNGGICLMVGGEGADALTLGETFTTNIPAKIVAVALPADLLAAVKATGAEVSEVGCNGQCGGPDALVETYTAGAGFDDIIVCGKVNDDCLEKLAAKLGRGGLCNIVCDQPTSRELSVDVGRIHYDDWYYVGNKGTDIGASYTSHRATTELKAGGSAWLLGAGGPMGQMHVQRACEMPNGPALIVASDIDPARLQELRERFIPAAEAHGRTLIVLNPKDFSPEDFEAKLRELTGGRGFDDVVALVPVPMLVKQAAAHTADGGLLNIFAGVVRGTQCTLALDDVYLRNIRWVGSSGSKISDMVETLRMAESGELLTANAVAAIGGLNAVYHGLELVKGQAIPGKIVIYQQIEDMPIIQLHELKDVMPTVAAKLRDGKYWTIEAENELLRLKLQLPA